MIGGNPGGCAAAVSAARSGCKVILLEPTKTLGGINANGVFAFDAATPQAMSGIAEEMEERIRAHYERIGLHDPLFTSRHDLVWESHVAATVWGEFLAATPGVTVLLSAVPVGVTMAGGRIHEVQWLPASDPSGNVAAGDTPRSIIRARQVIDASYEGDVMAWSGAPYRIGREARSWQEPHAGAIYSSNMEYSPSGYLPNSILPGSTGEGDGRIMAFACRLHCRIYDDVSPDAPHRLRLPPPGYDPKNYSWEPVGRNPDGSPVYFNTIYVLVNGKFLLNRMIRGNNLVGPNRDYILAHPFDRKPLRQAFIDYALGYLYFVQTEGGMPALGLADDEFTDNDGIPYQIYVREARRLEGLATLTEADVTPYIAGDGIRPPGKRHAIAITDWTLESHGCADDIPAGYKSPEGWLFNRVTRAPFQIPYGCLLPQGVDNLLVCGAISATHIAFSSVRVESARIQTGTAAGIAASLAVQRDCAPVEVPVEELQRALLARGSKLSYFVDVGSEHAHFRAIQWAALRGFVPRDEHWRFLPDNPIDWAAFVQAIVVCLRLPVSVSGIHFEGIGPRHPSFAYAEALYDLGTRADVDLFRARDLVNEDPLQAVLRPTMGPRLIPFVPDAPVATREVERMLVMVAVILGAPTAALTNLAAQCDAAASPSRGLVCAMLETLCP
ncbi:FAD-dependent oxidoreductase [Bosea caraganae]|uniref:FAD-dependent oxidoreductase n=1 Tax=Bosea caraganae TaxID=2763117 RepID=UPI0015F00CE3|nr:FAD-dependent oxidoreductase [Bosea caraganae]